LFSNCDLLARDLKDAGTAPLIYDFHLNDKFNKFVSRCGKVGHFLEEDLLVLQKLWIIRSEISY
jgi:hypothetical protein